MPRAHDLSHGACQGGCLAVPACCRLVTQCGAACAARLTPAMHATDASAADAGSPTFCTVFVVPLRACDCCIGVALEVLSLLLSGPRQRLHVQDPQQQGVCSPIELSHKLSTTRCASNAHPLPFR